MNFLTGTYLEAKEKFLKQETVTFNYTKIIMRGKKSL